MTVKYIGEYLGYIVYDMANNGIDPRSIHLVGHSLGAHIVGFAGKAYQLLKPGEILPRITGLDPAGPCFYNVSISSSDARFVDIIHTNDREFRIFESLGSVDFFPNGGGVMEPGCKIISCSHLRVIDYYVESVDDPENLSESNVTAGEDFYDSDVHTIS
ncbi:pancreatic lipase-related protein 2-like [Arctopsyche grandis]|uniref:pancreatic lipase-related protein 2-like n=1 Tax=Arctopsyche grandis TaxID=121162 RepID=UPI00406D8593